MGVRRTPEQLGHKSKKSDDYDRPVVKNSRSYMIKDKNGRVMSKLNYYDYKIKGFDWVLMANLDTKPEHRGKGLATKLLNNLCDDVSKNTSKGVYMFVRDTNENAIRLYDKLGFDRIKNYKLQDGNYIIMAKGDADKTQFDRMNFS